jgi:predicted DCC family thiol-disulfide oxidoreductase YuxK
MDHLRFSPIQTSLSQKLCQEYNMPFDLSTAVLIDENGGHTQSEAVLRLFSHMSFPYPIIGRLTMWLVPRFLRDAVYCAFAKNRRKIWIGVNRLTGMGDTLMDPYRDRVLGLEEPLDPNCGFKNDTSE